MAGKRLSQRVGASAPDGPYEGVPPHLKQLLVHWVDSMINSPGSGGYYAHERTIRELAAFMRLDLHSAEQAPGVARVLLNTAIADDEFFLDLVDGLLQVRGTENSAKNLARALDTAGSVWTVAPDSHSLVRVVSDEAQSTFNAAVTTADEAAKELREAWVNAFGRNGDPSDAWDHAIKAVEDVLIPVMMPKNGNATLGSVVGELAGQHGSQWKLVLPGNNQDHDVSHLVAMLRLMWPNHDRHGGATPKRSPSEHEARAVVTLAATIVQWHREGWVVQKR